MTDEFYGKDLAEYKLDRARENESNICGQYSLMRKSADPFGSGSADFIFCTARFGAFLSGRSYCTPVF